MDKELERLSEAAGVDLVALREKYRSRGSSNSSQAAPDGIGKIEDIAKANETLDKYSICKCCQGQGTIFETYNHFRMEKTCPECDGEAVVWKKTVEELLKAESLPA